jgi:hypothetical protein
MHGGLSNSLCPLCALCASVVNLNVICSQSYLNHDPFPAFLEIQD